MRTAPTPILTFYDDIGTRIKEALAPVFGGMTSQEVIPIDPCIVPEWRIEKILWNFLMKQTATRKREEKRNRKRSRDIDQKKVRRIVDGRTS